MENKKSFEQLLQELEQIVKELEAKDIQLEMAIKKYQEGIELAKLSYKMLEDANALIMKKPKKRMNNLETLTPAKLKIIS